LSVAGLSSRLNNPWPSLLLPAGARKLTYEDACDRVGGAANLERIRAVKDKYDPHNLFTCHPFQLVLATPRPTGQLNGRSAEQ